MPITPCFAKVGESPLLQPPLWTTGQRRGASPWTPVRAGESLSAMQEAALAGETLLWGSSLQTSLVSALSLFGKAEIPLFVFSGVFTLHRAVWWSCYCSVHCWVPSPPGPKSMQDSWCGDDVPLSGSRQTSWEEEEDVEIGMWNSSSSQEANPSLNWPPYMKKMPTKVRSSPGQGLQSFLKAESEGIAAFTHYTLIFILNTL